MATCTQCGAELKPGAKFCENCGAKVSAPQPAAQPAAVPQPPVQPTQAAPPAPTACTDAPAAAGKPAAIPMQAAHLPPRSPGRTQRILTQAMRPAHRRRQAQAHRFTPGKRPRLHPHRLTLPMLSHRPHRAARSATLTAMWPPAASPSAPAHQCPPSG